MVILDYGTGRYVVRIIEVTKTSPRTVRIEAGR